MKTLEQFMDDCLAQGRAYFLKEEALKALGTSPAALNMAILRQSRKNNLAHPRHGFYLILRPEDRNIGAPDPARWIDPLMKYLRIDYRIALLRAAAFYGASHQASMVFQVIVPKQMRSFEIGRHRLMFVYQNPAAFAKVNRDDWLGRLKSDAGFAKIAGVELTLLDCMRYFHKSGGISNVAQIIKDLGSQAQPEVLSRIAVHYENSTVRRLGYLLEHMRHLRQAQSLQAFAIKSKTAVSLDPSVKPLFAWMAQDFGRDNRWQLILNEPIEVDF